MKKVIIYFSVMAASCMLGSCSDLAFGDAFLEKAPGVDVTIDTIFSSKLYADNFLRRSMQGRRLYRRPRLLRAVPA